MPTETKRATIYFDEDIFRALKLKAVESSMSMSELVNEAVRHELLEDYEDLIAFTDRVAEETVPFETFVKQLKADGKI
jgi:hypothetical protein